MIGPAARLRRALHRAGVLRAGSLPRPVVSVGNLTVGGTGASADTRNMHALASLQTTNIFDGGKATYQSAFAQTVSTVGNKTREVQVNASANEALLKQVQGAALDVSGVNLDEEATNLLKYQQAYQAAAKTMQIASQLFDYVAQIR